MSASTDPTPPAESRTPTTRAKRPQGVDLVAVILATGLSLTTVLIIVATMVQIVANHPGAPQIQLSENATQILIAAIGGVVGVLGGYVGYRLHDRSTHEDSHGSER